VQVKLLAQEGELYVLAQSRDRVAKERAMRRRQLKRLWARLKQLSTMQLTREELLDPFSETGSLVTPPSSSESGTNCRYQVATPMQKSDLRVEPGRPFHVVGQML
jgi:hypothetical protein